MRKFGIELEMIAPEAMARSTGPLRGAANLISGTGAQVATANYTGRQYDVWQCKPDGSLSPAHRAVEVVSRIMPADESSYAEIQRVCDALTNAGFGVNRSCGFHVHVSVADLPVAVRQLIVLRYNALQNDINAMLPPSRRASSFAAAIGSGDRAQLAQTIRAGQEWFPSARYLVTNCTYARMNQGGAARIEFRQAGATTTASKVIGWVRFLQEMIDEVARRAAGVTFAAPAVTVAPAPVRPFVPAAPVATVPRMRPGSEAHRAFEQLRTVGAITAEWAAQNNIRDNVLRRIIVGFRRHGAGIRTLRTAAGATYVLAGSFTLPTTAREIFAPAPMPAPAPVAPAPAPAPVLPAVDAVAFVAFDFFAGLSAETAAWVRDRRDTFAADVAA